MNDTPQSTLTSDDASGACSEAQGATRVCPVCGGDASPISCHLGGYRLFCCSGCTLRFAPDAFGVEVDYGAIYNTEEYRKNQVQPLKECRDPADWAKYANYLPFFEQVHREAGLRLLDVGCGVGRFCHGAHSQGWDVTGIDVSDGAIEVARQYATFPVQRCTLEDMIESGRRFDVVTAFEVLEHLVRPVDFIRTLCRVVRPGGQVFCTVPNWDCGVVQRPTEVHWMPPVHLLFFTERALCRAGELGGLESVHTGRIMTDRFPVGWVARAKWLKRRLCGWPNHALGLWLHGWTAR